MVVGVPQSYIPGECIQIDGFYVFPSLYTVKGKPAGLYADFMRDLSKRYNFCYNLTVLNKADGIRKDENGMYPGNLGKVYKNEQAFSMQIRTLLPDLQQDFDYSEFMNIQGRGVLIKYPTLEPDILGIVKTFTPMVWYLLLLSFVIGAISLGIIVNKGIDSSNQHTKENRMSTGTIIVNSVKMYLNQSFGLQYSSNSSKLICGTLLLFTLITTLSYKCNLKAMMILPKISLPFKDIEGMLNQDKVKWFAAKGSALIKVAHRSPNGSLAKRWAEGLSLEATSSTEILNYVTTGKYAFTVVKDYILSAILQSYLMNNKTCSVIPLPDEFLVTITAWYFPKNSSWLPLINHGIKSFREGGITNFNNRIYNYTIEHCYKVERVFGLRPLTMIDMYGIFTIFLMGCLLGIISLFIEIALK